MKYFFKLSSLCREIAWDAIVLGGNKHFPGGVHCPGAIFLVAIIWGYISVVNIILRCNSLSASCPRANYLEDNFQASNFRWQLSGGQLSWGAIVRGAIILGDNYPGGKCPRGNYPGGNNPGGNCPVPVRNIDSKFNPVYVNYRNINQ